MDLEGQTGSEKECLALSARLSVYFVDPWLRRVWIFWPILLRVDACVHGRSCAGCVDEGVYFIMVSLTWSIQLCIEQYIQYKRLHFVQKSMGLPITRWTPDAVRTAIKIQSTFQCLRESCLLKYMYMRARCKYKC